MLYEWRSIIIPIIIIKDILQNVKVVYIVKAQPRWTTDMMTHVKVIPVVTCSRLYLCFIS